MFYSEEDSPYVPLEDLQAYIRVKFVAQIAWKSALTPYEFGCMFTLHLADLDNVKLIYMGDVYYIGMYNGLYRLD